MTYAECVSVALGIPPAMRLRHSVISSLVGTFLHTLPQKKVMIFWKKMFFFFYWLYNSGWVLVCSTILFHTCLSSIFTLQPVIFILLRSSSTWSIHINLGLPTGLVLYGFHSVIFLVVLAFSILITWATHLEENVTEHKSFDFIYTFCLKHVTL